MIEHEIVNLIGFVALAFSLAFAYAGTVPGCTYRKYIVPTMLLVIAAMLLPETIAAIMVAVSAVLIYSGYKEYGIKAREKEGKASKEEDSNKEQAGKEDKKEGGK